MVPYIDIEVAVKVHIIYCAGTHSTGTRQIPLSLYTCECTCLSTRQNTQSICLYAAVIHEQRIVIASRCIHRCIQLAAHEAGVLHVVHNHHAWGFTWHLTFVNHGRGSLEPAVQYRVHRIKHVQHGIVRNVYRACAVSQRPDVSVYMHCRYIIKGA